MQTPPKETNDRFENFLKTTYYTNLSKSYDTSSFCSGVDEYDQFLKIDALDQMTLGICNTHVLIHESNRKIIGYFSLSMSGLRLSKSEKTAYRIPHITYPQCPCLRLGKLAIDKEFKKMGYGSFIIAIVKGIAIQLSEKHVACRLLIVDADIQYDEGNLTFYCKCGFKENENRGQNCVTIGMHCDIYADMEPPDDV